MTERVHNKAFLKERRQGLRNRLTPAEAKLWGLIKGAAIDGRKFRRQHSAGPYILDFYCTSERLCIELDGKGHYTEGGYEYDSERTQYLNDLKIRVVRFENKTVFENPEGVIGEIRKCFSRTGASGEQKD